MHYVISKTLPKLLLRLVIILADDVPAVIVLDVLEAIVSHVFVENLNSFLEVFVGASG